MDDRMYENITISLEEYEALTLALYKCVLIERKLLHTDRRSLVAGDHMIEFLDLIFPKLDDGADHDAPG